MDDSLEIRDPDFKVDIDKEDLLPLLEHALVFVPGKDSDTSLLNFKLEVNDSFLTVSSSDSKVSLEITSSTISNVVTGVVLIPAKDLFSIVKSCNPGVISLSADTDKRNATVRSGETLWFLKLTVQRGFPEYEEFSAGKYEKISSTELFQAIARTKFAASKESLRPHYLLVDVASGVFSATDGLRFQQVRTGLSTSFCLPIGVISDIFKLWKISKDEEVFIGSFSDHFVFVFGTAKVTVQKPSFYFPSTEQVFQQAILSNDEFLSVSREELIDAVSKIQHTVDVDTSEIKLSIKKKILEVKSVDRAGNRSVSSLPCSWEGSPREVVVNYLHLYEALRYYPEVQANFYLGTDYKTKKSMLLLRSTDKTYFSVISQIISNRK